MDKLVKYIYWYCTDFCLNMANLLGISYVEFNMWLFLILFPGMVLLLFALNLHRYMVRPLLKKPRS